MVLLAWLVASAVGLLLFGGCASSPPPPPPVVVLPPPASEPGSAYFRQARQAWVEGRSQGLHGRAWAERLGQVIGLLENAEKTDPLCVLFTTKIAQLQLEVGPNYYDPAAVRFAGVLDRAKAKDKDGNTPHPWMEDWVPAWLGLAEVHIRRGELEQAKSLVSGADYAVKSLEKKGQSPARATLLDWLKFSEEWGVDNGNLVSPTVSANNLGTSGGLLRRVKARVEMARFEIYAAGNPPAEACVDAVNAVLAIDPNLLDARFAKARLLHTLRHFNDAVAQIEVYGLQEANPMLFNNLELVGELAALYKDWYLNEAKPPLYERAVQYYFRLHQLVQDDPASLLGRAELQIGREHGSKAEIKSDVEGGGKLLDLAREAHADPAAIARLREKCDAKLRRLQ